MTDGMGIQTPDSARIAPPRTFGAAITMKLPWGQECVIFKPRIPYSDKNTQCILEFLQYQHLTFE